MFPAIAMAASAAASAMSSKGGGAAPAASPVSNTDVPSNPGVASAPQSLDVPPSENASSNPNKGGIPNTKNLASEIGSFGNKIKDAASPWMSLYGQTKRGAKAAGERYGAAQGAAMREAYPNTNPWEQLGSGQAAMSAGQSEREMYSQERLALKTLSMNKYVADKQALASITPAILEQHPELAQRLLSEVLPGKSVGANLNTALGVEKNRREWFKASTGRLQYLLESERFEFDKVVADRVWTKDQAQFLREVYESYNGNLRKALLSSLSDRQRELGKQSATDLLREAIKKFDPKSDLLERIPPGIDKKFEDSSVGWLLEKFGVLD